MRLLGLDFEGTSLDAAGTARIIEYGAVLYDWDSKTILRFASEFVDPNEEITAEITAITGITNDMVQEFGVSEVAAVNWIRAMIDQADGIVAHFGNLYDRPLYEASCARYMSLSPDKLWIDTAVDVRFPERMTTRNLQHLAAEHGFLNPFRHRAVFDVLTMMDILAHYPIEDVIARAKEPMVYLEANVTFEEKELAKARGYRWCPPARVWWKAFKQSDAAAERSQCGFSTRILPAAPEK